MKEYGLLLCESKDNVERVYGETTLADLPTDGHIYTKAEVLNAPNAFGEVRYIFSTWGMPVFTEDEIKELFPSLRALFYAAGSVQTFAAPFLASGVSVYSAWRANAIPVAEYTLAQILLSSKGYFLSAAAQSAGELDKASAIKERYGGNYGATVGIIGVGMIGRRVIELLAPFSVRVLAYDAFLSAEKIEALGAEKVGLAELFASAEVISNHLADNVQTRGMIDYGLLSRMRPYATFINTGRGAQVNEADLVRLLSERGDLTALLDVTYPEPPEASHPFYSLPNCFLTPHIAGSSGREVLRMGEYMHRSYLDFCMGSENDCRVTAEMLKTMA